MAGTSARTARSRTARWRSSWSRRSTSRTCRKAACFGSHGRRASGARFFLLLGVSTWGSDPRRGSDPALGTSSHLNTTILAPMLRRACLRIALVLLPAVSLPADQPPSLVLLTLDTTRADYVGRVVAGKSLTPNLDALARSGARFTSALAPAPLTLPAHCSLMTGLEPSRARRARQRRFGASRRHPDAGGRPRRSRVRHGRVRVVAGPRSPFRPRPGLRAVRRRDGRRAGGGAGISGARRRGGHRRGARMGVGRLARPSLFSVGPLLRSARARTSLPATGSAGRATSGMRARWPTWIARSGVCSRSCRRAPGGRIVAAVGDHGEMLGEHGEKEHGIFVYRSALDVPLILSGPGIPAGRSVGQRVATRALPGTLLVLLGLRRTPARSARGSPASWRARRRRRRRSTASPFCPKAPTGGARSRRRPTRGTASSPPRGRSSTTSRKTRPRPTISSGRVGRMRGRCRK